MAVSLFTNVTWLPTLTVRDFGLTPAEVMVKVGPSPGVVGVDPPSS